MKFDPTLTFGFVLNCMVLLLGIAAAWGSLKRRLDSQDEERKELLHAIQGLSRQFYDVNERLARLEGRALRGRSNQ